tara:strand:+ start:1099 stop:1602 length:504 start_codon:yes stop_codon:yes gene_type:complete
MVKVYLSLGSNLGDRESNLAQATMALSVEANIFNIESSAYYASEPLYNLNQPDFLNSVLKCDTSLKAFDFFDVTKKVEKMLGRIRNKKRNQPRIIDIDILFFGNSILETSELTIPHPYFQFRKFVLIPLAEIEPKFKVPNIGATIKELIIQCPDKTNVRAHYMKSQA